MMDILSDPGSLLLALSILSFLAFTILFVTSFVKISIVLGLVRNAVGVPETPSGMVIAGLAVVLSMYVMYPVAKTSWHRISPIIRDSSLQSLPPEKRLEILADLWHEGTEPLRGFLALNSSGDIRNSLTAGMRSKTSTVPPPDSMAILAPSFLLTEISEAFEMAFFIFLPFLVIDLIVAAMLMSLGMHMVSPTTISLPFKLMLFAAVNGFSAISSMIINSYRYPF